MRTKLNLSCAVCQVVVAGLLPWSCVIAAEPTRTVILVRHAERTGSNDPSVGITEAGRCRAAVLAGMLSDAKARGIYTSELPRTQQTAEPLALRLSITPEVVPAKDIDALVAKLRARSEDGTVLVVGHSNTIPAIVQRLSGETDLPLARVSTTECSWSLSSVQTRLVSSYSDIRAACNRRPC